MSTIVSSNHSSVFLIFCFSNGFYSHNGDQTKDDDNPRAKYPDRTEKFLTDVKVALETLEDEVGSLSEYTRSGAYKNFLESYRDALIHYGILPVSQALRRFWKQSQTRK